MTIAEWFKSVCGLGSNEEAKPQTLLQKMDIDDIARLKAVVCARWRTDSDTQQRYVEMDDAEATGFFTRALALRIPLSLAPGETKSCLLLDEKGESAMKKHEAVWESLRTEAAALVAAIPVGNPVTVQNLAEKFRGALGQQVLYPLNLKEMAQDRAFLVPKALCVLGIRAYDLPDNAFAIDIDGAGVVERCREKSRSSIVESPDPR